MLVGVIIAAQLAFPTFADGILFLSYGRLRPLHTNAVIFAFCGSGLFAASYYVVQRTCQVRLFGGPLVAFTFSGWMLVIVLAANTLPLGITSSKEYAELEWPIDLLIAALVTIYIAVVTDDGLVSDDYYKEGLAIHIDADRGARAQALGITGSVSYDAETGAVTVEFGESLSGAPPQLTLSLVHPTLPNQDQTTQLTGRDGRRYAGRIEPLGPANWRIQLEPDDASWHITGRMKAPDTTRSQLR